MLYQLSYLGPLPGLHRGRTAAQATGSLTLVRAPVHPERFGFGIDRRTRDPVSVSKPLQQVAVLAACAAERCELR